MDELEKTNQVNLLIDMYGELLTEKQRQYLKMYYEEDLSLAEIGEMLHVSRNAVYDQLRRSRQILDSYEQHLGLLAKHEARLHLIEKIEADDHMEHDALHTYLERLKEI